MAYHNIVCARTSRAVRILALAALAGCQATPVGTAAGLANPVTTDELRRQASPQLVATGRFVSKGGESTSGTYRIERVSGDLRLVLEPDFETSKGPDLHVVLSPVDVAAAGNRNVMPKGQARVLGDLRSLKGAQTFDLPDRLDLSQFRSVLIHCIRYSHLYGAAPLELNVRPAQSRRR